MQLFTKLLGQSITKVKDERLKISLVALTLIASISTGLLISGRISLHSFGFQVTVLGGIVLLFGGAPVGLAALYAMSFLATWFYFGISGLTTLWTLGPWMGIFLFLIGIVILSKGKLDLILYGIQKCWGFAFLIAYTISGLILAPVFYDNPIEHISWTFIVTMAVMCLSVFITSPSAKVFKITSKLLVLAFWVMFVLYSYFSFFTRGTTIVRSGIEFMRVNQVFGGGNDSAGLFVTLLPFGLVVLTGRRYLTVIKWVVLSLAAYCVYRSFTRMAWIDLPVVLGVYFWILGDKRTVIILAIMTFLIALYSSVVRTLFSQILQSGGINQSAQNTLASRIYIAWLPMIRLTLKNWQTILIGSGDATYFLSSNTPLQGNVPIMSHNLWVERFVTRGVLGLVLWLSYMIAIPINAIRAMLAVPIKRRAWFAAGIASWVGYNIYALSANAQVDVSVITNILAGICMWAYARSLKTEHSVVAKGDLNHG